MIDADTRAGNNEWSLQITLLHGQRLQKRNPLNSLYSINLIKMDKSPRNNIEALVFPSRKYLAKLE